jgi:predicted AlkP superfamily phosphohydrolase/phosphomutase
MYVQADLLISHTLLIYYYEWIRTESDWYFGYICMGTIHVKLAHFLQYQSQSAQTLYHEYNNELQLVLQNQFRLNVSFTCAG